MSRSVRAHWGARVLLGVFLLISYRSPLLAQSWNTPETMTLVRRAVDRRVAAQADSSLTSYRARAHGFLFFLAQVGEGLAQPPKLVKTDQLEGEGYWQGPKHNKQGEPRWRGGALFP